MPNRTDLETYDEKYFDFLFPLAYPEAPESVFKFLKEQMIPSGDVSIESLLETAISITNGIKKESSAGYDFLNKDGSPGGDAKKSTAFLNPCRPRREATIRDFHNKIGDLYVCVYEPHLEKFYFFTIPPSRYRGCKTLTVYFERDGTPRRRQMRYDADPPLWEYEVKDIKNLYGFKKKSPINLFEIT